MQRLREFVNTLTEAQCRAIHAESIIWEQTGIVRNGALRQAAEEWSYKNDFEEHNETLWMREIVNEVWRRFAAPQLEQ